MCIIDVLNYKNRHIKMRTKLPHLSFKHLIFRSVLVMILISSSTNLFAKGIRGTIIDNLGNPIPETSIFFKEIQTGITANSTGFYETSLKEGTYTVTFQSLGYLSQEFRITISDEIGRAHV